MIEVGPAIVAYSRVGHPSGDPAPNDEDLDDAPWLTASDRARALRWGPGLRRARFVEGRRLLRQLISRLAPDANPAIEARCARCGSRDHGAVRALRAPVVVSISYSGPAVAAAAAPARAATGLGIDVESGAPDEILRELAALFAPADPPTRRRWTEIEAAVKADGRGLRIPPERIRFAGGGATVPGAPGPFAVLDARAPEGLTASLALRP